MVGNDVLLSDVAPRFSEFAHDMRNPIASIQGCAQTLLDREDVTPELAHALLEVIVRQSFRLDDLLRLEEERVTTLDLRSGA